MNEVKRYHEFKNGVVENEHGMFVTHEDYAALQQQLTATTNSLTNAQEALKSAGIEADTVQAGVMELVSRMNRLSGEREKFAVQCAAAKIAVQYARAEGFECSLNTPDVDAYLNAVRAEGVDIANKELKALADRSFNEAPKAYEHIHAAALYLVIIANQLRAGNAGKDGV
jgi:hypothetical protein